jgi:hypothetical protein
MVGHDIFQKVEPEKRNLVQYLSLVRDAGRENVIKRGDSVRGYKQEAVIIQPIYVADLPASMKSEILEFGTQQDGFKYGWAHG